MGSELFRIEVSLPNRLFTDEVGVAILKEQGVPNPHDDLDVFQNNEKTGLLVFDAEVYDEEPIMKILMDADIPFTLKREETLECGAISFTYRPTYEPVDGGKLEKVDLNNDGMSCITTDEAFKKIAIIKGEV